MIKILLADDHVIVRDGVKAVLERKGKDLEVVGEVGNGQSSLGPKRMMPMYMW